MAEPFTLDVDAAVGTLSQFPTADIESLIARLQDVLDRRAEAA